MTKKMTKREAFSGIVTILEALYSPSVQPFVDAMEHEIDLLDRKAANSKREAAKAVVVQSIQRVLIEADEPMRATAILAEGAGSSIQQVAAILRQMVMDGTVVRTQDKKVVTFSLA